MSIFKVKANIIYFFIIFILLLIPLKGYFTFIILSSILLSLILFIYKVFNKKIITVIMIFLLYFLITLFIRFLFVGTWNLRDFIEIFRYMPFILILVNSNFFSKLEKVNFLIPLKVYLIIDTVITFLQVKNINIAGVLGFVKKIYNSEIQYNVSLEISNRGLGLSSGPGQHGSMLVFILIFFIIDIFHSKKLRSMNFIFIAFAFYDLFLTQSRTALIAALILLIFSFVIFFFKTTFKIQILITSVIFCALLFHKTIIGLFANFSYLNVFLKYGLKMSSFMARENKWEYYLNEIQENPLFFVIGYGKEYFGTATGSMDSDYLYLLVIYGFLIFFLFLLFLFFILIRLFLSLDINDYFKSVILFQIIAGLIIGISSSYFFDAKILTLMGLVIVKYIQKS